MGETTMDSQFIEARITSAYRSLSGGKSNVRVRLADLRTMMPEIGRDDFDSVILAMQTEGKLILFGLDVSWDRTPRDAEAAINVCGFQRHIVYIG